VEKNGNMLVLAAELGLACVLSSRKSAKDWRIRSLLCFVLSVQIFHVSLLKGLKKLTHKGMA
jgi:hypothetical protein